jgi:hypothetical protein
MSPPRLFYYNRETLSRGVAVFGGKVTENYDHEKNPLIAVEEPYVEELLKGITYSNVLDAGAVTGEGTQAQGDSGDVVSLRKGDIKWEVTWKTGLCGKRKN